MKASPFSDLKLSAPSDSPASGSDQRLFAPTPSENYRAAEPEASAPSHARTSVSSHEGTPAHSPARAPIPTPEQSSPRASGDAEEPTHARSLPRGVGRHSHDLFQDQIRWLNRLKLELTERCGEPITGNAMVQLAVDMLREDYVRNGENSELIRVLVQGRSRTLTPQSVPDVAVGEGAR